ncbi:MAG: SDR family NAD(P)-dependent oxidoreductase, partial [Candidatus Electrothrix sp. AW5]|nr:SDR family NAD(P)-dependent oxidoreductase [Candidatus Electrothrix gigas]
MEILFDMSENIFSIKDKVIIITGAFGLIGKEISRSYLKNNARVVIAGHSSHLIESVHDEFSKNFNPDSFLVCDLDITNPESVAQCLAATISQFERVDVLVNNAAIDAKFDQYNEKKIESSRFENYPIELIRKSVEVNLIGTVQMTQAVCQQMLQQGRGNIINVASSYSLVSPNQQLYDYGENDKNFKPVDYVASKSFIPNFTRYLATLYAKEHIRCNAVAPHG